MTVLNIRRARRGRRRGSALLAALAVMGVLTSCAATGGTGSPATQADVPDAQLPVVDDSGSRFDATVKNALSDVETFWRQMYPQISGGKSLPALQGKLYSVDGANPGPQARQNGCLAKEPDAVEDNAFYCRVDDSVAWDRDPQHLVPVLGQTYGQYLIAMVFAHEFGHAIQNRLGTFDTEVPTIDTESQADCASGAFTAWVIAGHARHFKITPAQLDKALSGYLQVRDPVPASSAKISHGNGFDRLGAVEDGIQNGVTSCYSKDYFDRKFTERPYTTDSDYENNGNLPLTQILNDTGGGLFTNLNAYWKAKAQSIGKTWTDVKTAEAGHPKCGASSSDSEFGYCPDDNTVYYSTAFATAAYNSISAIDGDQQTGNIRIATGQPGDYALGTMFVYGWGLAVRHQLFNRSLQGTDALLAASCYAGAYSSSINVAQTANTSFVLSPADMDEAVSAILNLVPQDRAFGSQNTSALQRIVKFNTGYFSGLQKC